MIKLTIGTLSAINAAPFLPGETFIATKDDEGYWYNIGGESIFMGDDEEIESGELIIAKENAEVVGAAIIKDRLVAIAEAQS